MPIDPNRLCVCHGEPMLRVSVPRYTNGFSWRCHVKVKERDRVRNRTEARKSRNRGKVKSAANARNNPRRVFVGGDCVRIFKSAAVAQAVQSDLRQIKQAVLQGDMKIEENHLTKSDQSRRVRA